MVSAEYINRLLKSNISKTELREMCEENGISVGRSESEMYDIANRLKDEIIDTFLRTTRHADADLAAEYFDSVHVNAIRKAKNYWTIDIVFPSESLFRPSLIGIGYYKDKKRRRGYVDTTSNYGGIKDIFALITNGTSTTHTYFGDWIYATDKKYATNGRFVPTQSSSVKHTTQDLQDRL